jgi:tetratricopeptide (TPR) repeat protein
MSLATMKIEPELPAREREEMAHLDYLGRRMVELRARGLISPECYQAIATDNQVRREDITRRGTCLAVLNRARKLTSANQMTEALEWAGRARAMEPEARGAWDLEISLCSALGRHDEAIALCEQAALRFPDLAARLESLRREGRNRDAQARRSAEKARKEPPIAGPIEPTRQQPEAFGATVTSGITPYVLAADGQNIPDALSWSSIAGEFPQEHWQKLILCLAVLLIVVSSTVLGRETINTVRTAGLIVTYLAMATPIWQDRSFGDWVGLLLGSLLGLFFGIGLRVQTFVWLGLATFLLDVLYELGRVSLDHALAKWAIMLSLGISLVFFVALNEKKQIVRSMRGYFEEVRSWE